VLRSSTICVVFAAGFLALVAVSPAAGAGKAGTQGSFLQAVNSVRAAHGLQPLRLDAALERAARAHTLEMLRENIFGHGDFSTRMAAFHLRGMLGENLAWGSGPYGRAQTMVQLWLGSATHRANLLRPGFRRIGFGIASGVFQGQGGATVVTADFAG
jgi:uncharacterized protein YkwD